MVDAAIKEEEASNEVEDTREAEDTNKAAEASRMEEDSKEADSIRIRVEVSEEAEAMNNTFRVILAPLQPTRLDNQDGMDITTNSTRVMIRDHTTPRTRDGTDNQLSRETAKVSTKR